MSSMAERRVRWNRRVSAVLLVTGLATGSVAVAPPVMAEDPAGHSGSAVIDDPACLENTLTANDDGSTAEVPLGFQLRFGDHEYSSV